MLAIKQNLKKKSLGVLLALFFMAIPTVDSIQACMFVSLANYKTALVGYNEDGPDLRSKIWFIPANEKAYGRVLWGFDRAFLAYQGGMNEKGLFFDINSCENTGWKPDPKKLNLDPEIDTIDYVLSHFSSVDGVIELFEKYNIDLSTEMWVFADAKGHSVIFEWAANQLKILKKKQGYQVCTNNLQSIVSVMGIYPCRRWEIADKILQNQTDYSLDIVRRVLSATCMQSYYCATSYSTICDLANQKVFLYYYHNFEEPVLFDLKTELAKGESGYLMEDLFKVKPYASYVQKRIGIKWGDEQLMKITDEKGIKEAVSSFKAMKDETQTYNKFFFMEWNIRNAGLEYLAKNKIEEAIEIFKLNTQEYPDSWQTYYDLADAYMENKNIPLAIENYRKALEKNPGNKKIESILGKLKKKMK